MCARHWLNGPLGAGSTNRVTVPGCRKVLVIVPHVVAGTRLMDLLPLLDADHRLQVYFTLPESCGATVDFVRAVGGSLLPWEQAMQHEFDLVLAASYRYTDQISGPVLVLPHGAGALKSRRRVRSAGVDAEPVHGLDRQLLMRDGRVAASVIALSHDDEVAALAESCPQALPAAVVAGDICLDRLRASVPYRQHYRHALGVGPGETLVTVSSTWTPESTFALRPDLYRELLSSHRVAAVLHPNIWTVHSAWQVRAWLADCDGLLIIPPEEGWRATMIASDIVIGDHGSTTQYAAAIGTPVLMATCPEVRVGSLAHVLAAAAPRLDPDACTAAQLSDAVRVPEMARLISSRLDDAGAILRSTMYRLLGIPEPPWALPISPVPLPRPIHHVR